jgi:hypothetical protein
MDQATLVGRRQSEGRELTRELAKDEDLGLTASFWWFEPETADWSLVLASRLFRTAGPKKVYERVSRALAKIKQRLASTSIQLSDVRVTSDRDPRVLAMASAITAEDTVTQISESMMNGVYVHDALLYRLLSPDAAGSTPQQTEAEELGLADVR